MDLTSNMIILRAQGVHRMHTYPLINTTHFPEKTHSGTAANGGSRWVIVTLLSIKLLFGLLHPCAHICVSPCFRNMGSCGKVNSAVSDPLNRCQHMHANALHADSFSFPLIETSGLRRPLESWKRLSLYYSLKVCFLKLLLMLGTFMCLCELLD